MSIARQHSSKNFQGSSVSITTSKPTATGSLWLVDVAVNGGSDVNVHIGGSAWTIVGTRVDRLTSVTITTFARVNAPGSSGNLTIGPWTLVLSSDDSTATTRYGTIFFTEYAGMAISSVDDQVDSASGSSTTIDTGATPTTTQAGDVAHVIAAHANAPNAADLNANTTGYTLLSEQHSPSTGTDRITAGVYEKQLGAAGSGFQFTTTISGGISRAWCVQAVALKTVSTTPATPGVPCAQGLFRAGVTTLDRMPPVMNGITYYPDWSALEAANTGALNGPAVATIDSLITYCNTHSIQLKLRVFVNGNNAAGGAPSCPAWLTALCGTFKHANSQNPSSPETMTRFWVQAFQDYYDRLMSLMSARWDSAPELVDVTISLPMMKYAEPLIRDLPIAANRAELVGGGNGFGGSFIAAPGAGYTDAKNIAAIKAAMDTHAAYWPNTCSSFAYNPYQSLTSFSAFDLNDDAQLSQTKALMAYQRQVLGPRAVLENNSVRSSYFTYDGSGAATGFSQTVPSYTLMYQAMIAQGPPLFFQTATSARIGDLSQTMDGIINILGGNAVEPPTDYASQAGADYSTGSFTTYNAELLANPTGAGTTTIVVKTFTDSGQGVDTLTADPTGTTVQKTFPTDSGSGADTVSHSVVTIASKHRPAKRS